MKFTDNRKTILSVDFDRTHTCPQICSYCYVETTEKLYKAYKTKITTNYTDSLSDPTAFAVGLNNEYKKARESKSKKYTKLHKLPVRIYGSGDYIPIHYEFISRLDFKFYIISKSLTMSTMKYHLTKLLKLNKLTKIILSFDKDNIKNYKNVKQYFKKDRIGFSFTGTPEEFIMYKKSGLEFNIFFNTQKNKKNIAVARLQKEQCPCDTKLISSVAACTTCNKCWRSSNSTLA